MYAGSREARKRRARRSHRRRNGVCGGSQALPGRGLGRQAILRQSPLAKAISSGTRAKMGLLGLSGTHHVNATEIKDGKIWMSDTLRQLQSDWIVSVPKQIQAAMVAPKL